jgi:hypothetical protein
VTFYFTSIDGWSRTFSWERGSAWLEFSINQSWAIKKYVPNPYNALQMGKLPNFNSRLNHARKCVGNHDFVTETDGEYWNIMDLWGLNKFEWSLKTHQLCDGMATVKKQDEFPLTLVLASNAIGGYQKLRRNSNFEHIDEYFIHLIKIPLDFWLSKQQQKVF